MPIPSKKVSACGTAVALLLLSVTPQSLADRGPVGRPGNDRPGPGDTDFDNALSRLIERRNLAAIDAGQLGLPTINDPKAQLGRLLFHAKNLGGEASVACASCHHPVLGGGDDLSLSVGVDAVDVLDARSDDLLGLGRFHGSAEHQLPQVPRNASTIFNIGLNDDNMFWDGRIERNRDGAILTPESLLDNRGRRQADASLPQDASLAMAQARFPVTSQEEMRGDFQTGLEGPALRDALNDRFDNSMSTYPSNWPVDFEAAFGDRAVTYDRIAEAIGEYERSMVFVNSPWNAYLAGDQNALSEAQKRGALLFFNDNEQGGAGCATCHRGANFSDNRFHLVAYPQIGPGKQDDGGSGANSDFGRERVTGETADRYHFRTPSLLNVAQTAPYGHAGSYQTLEQVVRHYRDPQQAIDAYFGAANGIAFSDPNNPAALCDLPQLQRTMEKTGISCEDLYPYAYANSSDAADRLQQAREGLVDARSPLRRNARLSERDVQDLVVFLHSLSDPCVSSRACLSPWILDSADQAGYPDDAPLQAHDENYREL